MTKTISPVSVWHNGQTVSATKLYLKCIDDDLDSQASYYWEIRSVTDVILGTGNLTMSGTDYTNRTGNTYTWNWAASQLSLTLT
jgi:hypothetical protein